MPRLHLTDEQIEYILVQSKTKELSVIHRELGLNCTLPAFHHLMKSRGYVRLTKWYDNEDVINYLKSNINSADSYQDMANRINEEFGLNCTLHQIKNYCKNHKMLIGKNTGQFIKGQHKFRVNIGDEVQCKGFHDDGSPRMYVCVKRDGFRDSSDFIPKQQYLWEHHNRPINKDEVVIFLDGDKTNYSLENLECVKRKDLLSAVKSNMIVKGHPELNKLGCKYWNLQHYLKEVDDGTTGVSN